MPANVQSMAYRGQVPWHGLGTVLTGNESSAQIMEAAGLGWSVETLPVYAALEGDKSFIAVPNRFATYRRDTNAVLGVVGRNYTPVQNSEAFQFFDAVVEGKQAEYEVAGALGSGEQVWLLAKLPGDIRVGNKDDIVEKRLLLLNSHDGLSSLKMFFTPTRVVCQNTLSVALNNRKANEGINIKHFPGVKERVQQAQEVLGIATRKFDELGESFAHLQSVKIDAKWLDKYVKLCFPVLDGSKLSHQMQKTHGTVKSLMESPSNTIPGAGGTAWAAYNSVTEYVDWYRRSRNTGSDNGTTRLRSIWIGSGAVLKEHALKTALEMAK